MGLTCISLMVSETEHRVTRLIALSVFFGTRLLSSSDHVDIIMHSVSLQLTRKYQVYTCIDKLLDTIGSPDRKISYGH